MPAATASRSQRRSTAARSRAAARGNAPAARAPVARVPWDRLARTALLGVMVVLAYFYLSAGLRLLSAWGEGRHDSAQVRSLEAQNRALRRQHALLSSPGAEQAQARRLGMIRAGEQAYVVSGLPDN